MPPLNAYTLPIPSPVIFEAQLAIFEKQPGCAKLGNKLRMVTPALYESIAHPSINVVKVKIDENSSQFQMSGDIRNLKTILNRELDVEAHDALTLLSPVQSETESDIFRSELHDLCTSVGWQIDPSA